jgi:hypothetical protein
MAGNPSDVIAMKLVRYATVYLQPSPARELQMVDLNIDTVEVHLRPAGKDAHQSRFLIEAAVVLNERPEVLSPPDHDPQPTGESVIR